MAGISASIVGPALSRYQSADPALKESCRRFSVCNLECSVIGGRWMLVCQHEMASALPHLPIIEILYIHILRKSILPQRNCDHVVMDMIQRLRRSKRPSDTRVRGLRQNKCWNLLSAQLSARNKQRSESCSCKPMLRMHQFGVNENCYSLLYVRIVYSSNANIIHDFFFSIFIGIINRFSLH